ncbi:hypothetical protein BDV38DRAFT_265482 [Aspergillus pseudotamarii]|uniref:Uncharacterized protein n=1 Tax=Aspergillus pseudotamarii TaxID=132259 RepID=A0A5N6SBQ2_ASPPS|nr:uncharacterized protein BDV38DRAFT_265482 [Aspergillus pseudotamarii]KAE8131091.1 hypothetical protein BDV38DRAFT_265482 [Aspergillus pseudotamarii]
MKQLLVLSVMLAMTGATVSAAAIPAQKVPLTRTNRNCDGSLASPTELTESFGFANLVQPASGKLVAAVVLQGATPSATYKVRLIQAPMPSPCYDIPSTTLITDSSGNGNTNFQQPVDPSATAAFVDLNNLAHPNEDYFTTNPNHFKLSPPA